jgi:hypothetical protein
LFSRKPHANAKLPDEFIASALAWSDMLDVEREEGFGS